MENMSLARKNTISEMNMNIDPAGDQPVTSVAVQDTPHTHTKAAGKGGEGKPGRRGRVRINSSAFRYEGWERRYLKKQCG